MTDLSEYDPTTHGKPDLLVAPWDEQEDAKRWVDRNGGMYVHEPSQPIRTGSEHHIVIAVGSDIEGTFVQDLSYTHLVPGASMGVYDQFYEHWKQSR